MSACLSGIILYMSALGVFTGLVLLPLGVESQLLISVAAPAV